MPCLHSESLGSLRAEGGVQDGPSPTGGLSPRPGQSRERVSERDERGQRVVTSARWLFSPLWSRRTQSGHWGFREGLECQQVEAWLDNHADFARSYFFRKSSRDLQSSWFVEKALIPREGEPIASLALAKGRRESHPLVGTPWRMVVPSMSRSLSSLSVSPPRDDFPPERAGGHLPWSPQLQRLPRSPSSPRSPRLPRSQQSPQHVGLCSSNNCCDWMTALLETGVSYQGRAEFCHKVLQHAYDIIAAQRCSLTTVTRDNGGNCSLGFTLCSVKTTSENHIHPDWDKCIMGYVVRTGRSLNIRDIHEDPRFHSEVGQITGCPPRSILSVPIQTQQQGIVGVAMAVNKRSSGSCAGCSFTDQDEKVLLSHTAWLGLILENLLLRESFERESKRSLVLQELAQLVSKTHPSLESLLGKLGAAILPVTHASRCSVFLADESSDTLCYAVHIEHQEEGRAMKVSKREIDFSDITHKFALHVRDSMETLSVANISDSSAPKPGQLAGSAAPQMMSLICCPVRDEQRNKVIAVCQLVRKGGPYQPEGCTFSPAEERLLQDLAVYCKLGQQRVRGLQAVERAGASLAVTREVLSYHIAPSQADVHELQEAVVPSAESLCVLDFGFSDVGMTDTASCQAAVRMFLDLHLVQDFSIEYTSLCQWVLSVRRGYRSNVAYHNWSHALNTAQCMFAMLRVEGQLQSRVTSLEILALMIATLCHDLDHRGVNNTYIERSGQPLAQLYGSSSLEHHHYALCLLILNNPGSQILGGLSEMEYDTCLQMIQRNILATDLAVYMERRAEFFELAKSHRMNWREEKHRELLRSMLMTASDISAITKPWPVQKRIAELVATEFFAQGDREKRELGLQPTGVMDRANSGHLPCLQVQYIDGVCCPLYEALAGMFESCSSLLEGCRRNREQWNRLAKEGLEEEGCETKENKRREGTANQENRATYT